MIKAMVIGGIAGLLFGIPIILQAYEHRGDFERGCEARSGKPMALFHARLCLSADGRIMYKDQ